MSGCNQDLWADIQEIYEELQKDVDRAGPVCRLSGKCCRFSEYGHTLFVSTPEVALLLEEGLPDGAEVNADGCPFQKGVMCTAHQRRPLGCRVFFCDPDYQDASAEISEKYIARLKQLCDAHGLAWSYQPLHLMLTKHLDNAIQ